MNKINTFSLENQPGAASKKYLDDEQYTPIFNSKCDELLRSGLCSRGSLSAKATMLLSRVGILRAANDSPKERSQPTDYSQLPQLDGRFGDKARTAQATTPQSGVVESIQTGSKLATGKGRQAKATEPQPDINWQPCSESKVTLMHVSEDFGLYTGGGTPVAYEYTTGVTMGRDGFVLYCREHYGMLTLECRGEDGSIIEKQTMVGSTWWDCTLTGRRVFKSIVMEPTNKSQHDADQTVLNRWYVLKKTMIEPDYNAGPNDIAPLTNHLMFLSDGDDVAVMYFLNWLAQLYQFPETKIPVAILMYSKSGGVGKNLIQRLLKRVFGKPLVTGVTGKALQKNFDDAIEHKRLVFINEVARSEKADGYENFKSQISEEEGQFEGKNRASKEIRNIAHYIITTNNLDALPLMQGDRRMAVMMCNALPRDESYYRGLVEWIDGNGAAALANVLRTWQFPEGWNPYAPAPQTEAAKLMQRESRGALHALVEELIEGRKAPFDRDLVEATAASLVIGVGYGRILPRETSSRNLGRVLNDLCGKPSQKDIKRPGRPVERQVRYYVVRNAEKWGKSTPEERGIHLETGDRPFEEPTETIEAESQS